MVIGSVQRGIKVSGRAGTLTELMLAARCLGWDQAYGDYLREFRESPALEALVNPPEELKGYHRALMAAVVETLAEEQGWPVPSWVLEPSCFLDVLTLALPERIKRSLDPACQKALLDVLGDECPKSFRARNLVAKWDALHPK